MWLHNLILVFAIKITEEDWTIRAEKRCKFTCLEPLLEALQPTNGLQPGLAIERTWLVVSKVHFVNMLNECEKPLKCFFGISADGDRLESLIAVQILNKLSCSFWTGLPLKFALQKFHKVVDRNLSIEGWYNLKHSRIDIIHTSEHLATQNNPLIIYLIK